MANSEMWDGSHLKKTDKRPREAKTKLTRRTHIASSTEKQKVRQAFLAGIKAERIASSFEHFALVRCELCSKCFYTTPKAHDGLDLHHQTKRSAGPPYEPGKGYGVDDPTNLLLICRDCHRNVHQSKGTTPKDGPLDAA